MRGVPSPGTAALSLARLPSSWLRPGAEPELCAARLLRALRDHRAAGERGGGVASPRVAGAGLEGALLPLRPPRVSACNSLLL